MSTRGTQFPGELFGNGKIILLFILIRNITHFIRLPLIPLDAFLVLNAGYRKIPLPVAFVHIKAFCQLHVGGIVIYGNAVVL